MWPLVLWSSVLTCLSLVAVFCCFILNGKISQLEGEVRRLQSQDHQRFMNDDVQKVMSVEVERLIQKVRRLDLCGPVSPGAKVIRGSRLGLSRDLPVVEWVVRGVTRYPRIYYWFWLHFDGF